MSIFSYIWASGGTSWTIIGYLIEHSIESRLVQVLGCSMDSKYSKWINSPPSYHSPKPSLRTNLSLNFSKTWNQFHMNCRNTRSLPSNSIKSTTSMTFKWKIKITLANVTGWDQNCQVQTRITPTMICRVDRTWYFLSHNMNTHHRF